VTGYECSSICEAHENLSPPVEHPPIWVL